MGICWLIVSGEVRRVGTHFKLFAPFTGHGA